MADLERSDTVAREPSMRAKTIIIHTVRVRVRAKVQGWSGRVSKAMQIFFELWC